MRVLDVVKIYFTILNMLESDIGKHSLQEQQSYVDLKSLATVALEVPDSVALASPAGSCDPALWLRPPFKEKS